MPALPAEGAMKPENTVPEPFRSILATVFEAEAFSGTWREELRQCECEAPGNAALIQRQWADAILNDTVTPAAWRALTGERTGSQDGVRIFLRDVWLRYYGYELNSEEDILPLDVQEGQDADQEE